MDQHADQSKTVFVCRNKIMRIALVPQLLNMNMTFGMK